LEAFERWGNSAPELVIVGDGPEAEYLKSRFPSSNIQWLGQLSPERAVEELAQSRLLVFPSICFEGFPMVVREALACGVPILSTDLGPMADIVQESFGQHFKSSDPQDLMDEMQNLWESQDKLKEMAVQARAEFDEKYTAEKNFKILMGIYNEAISVHTGKNDLNCAIDTNNQSVRMHT
jgi:glycosyltransferase involved in cell wall biosynthesis